MSLLSDESLKVAWCAGNPGCLISGQTKRENLANCRVAGCKFNRPLSQWLYFQCTKRRCMIFGHGSCNLG